MIDPRLEEDLRQLRETIFGRPPRSTIQAHWPNALLFALTAASIYHTGGARMAVALMSILLAHEMGHYLFCRWYRVDATLPFFIPLPVVSLVGTLGAFIKIQSPIPDRRALLDIGVTGPLAGFLVCLPVLFFGMGDIAHVPAASTEGALTLGSPLLFDWAFRWLAAPVPEGMVPELGPVAMAAWFGLLVTALNLMPIGQLDGGHVAYALLHRRYRVVSRAALGACLVLLYFRPTWLLWTLLLLVLGRRHPPTLNDSRPLNAGRVAVGILGFAVFAVCFTPAPFVVTWGDFFEGLRALYDLLFTSR